MDRDAVIKDMEGAEKYLTEKNITPLFQSLTAALVHHRPEDPAAFLLQCIEHIKSLDGGSDAVFWDTCLDLPNTRSSSRNLSRIRIDLTGLCQGQREDESEESSRATDRPESRNADEHIVTSSGDALVDDPGQVAQREASQDDHTTAITTDQGDKSQAIHDEHTRSNTTESPTDATSHAGKTAEGEGEVGEPVRPVIGKRGHLVRSNGTLDQVNRANNTLEQLDSTITDIGEDPDLDLGHPDLVEWQASDDTLPGCSAIQLRILRGSIQDLPAIPTKTVRIFLSSTFSDFRAERNMLPQLAYPSLQTSCGQMGLDFQVVDMRWGVTDDAINDHQVSELCLREITRCHQVSKGPFFVAFLGDRYGHRPLPPKIDDSEFDALLTMLDGNQEGKDLLCRWYYKDDNSIPPVYILQPIYIHYKSYNDMREESFAAMTADREEWQSTFTNLQQLLRRASKAATEKQLMKEADAEKYNISVTESEIQHALVTIAEENDHRGLCYSRSLMGLQEAAGQPMASRYLDIDDEGQVSTDSIEYSRKLRAEKVPTWMKDRNTREYEVPWQGAPLEVSTSDQHSSYLKKFCHDFVEDIEKLVHERFFEDMLKDDNNVHVDNLYFEVLHHATFAQRKAELVCGRDDMLDLMHKYISGSFNQQQPLVIHGKSGYGKTCLLAKAADCVYDWLEAKHTVVVTRFLGTTPESSNIFTLLKSVIDQICVAFDYQPPKDTTLEKFGDVRRYFWRLLERIGQKHQDKKLVLFLDSVDQLSLAHNSHGMLWLPRPLPENVLLVVSILNDRYTCLDNARARLTSSDSFIELHPLSLSAGEKMVTSYMQKRKRKLTTEQHSLVTNVMKQCRQPLFLKMVLDSACIWCSFTAVSSIHVSCTVHEAIIKVFKDLEVTYGQVFVQRALGYLTCSVGGLTEIEMEDVLSCDDDVLSEVYQYHDPPVEGTIRIPSLLWARVQHDLQEYLSWRQVHKKTVLTWYHRQFWETAQAVFVDQPGTEKQLTATLAKIYDQESGIRSTITLKHRRGKVIENADRQVNPQPLNEKNVRKLVCLPHFLLKSGSLERLVSTCLVSFNWSHLKLRALGVSEVLSEYNEFASHPLMQRFKVITLMRDFVEMCYDSLQMDANLLAFNVVERLGSFNIQPYEHNGLLENFIKNAKRRLEDPEDTLLVPVHPMEFASLDSPLKWSMMAGGEGVVSPDEKFLICCHRGRITSDNKLQVLALESKDIVGSVSIAKVSPVVVNKDSKYFYYIEGEKLNTCDVNSGELVHTLSFCSEQYEQMTIRAMTLSTNGKYIAFAVRFGKPVGLDKDNKWKAYCPLFLANIEEQHVTNCEFRSRKPMDRIIFAENDTKIVALGKDHFCVFSVPDLGTLWSSQKMSNMYSSLTEYVGDTLITPMTAGTSSKLLLCNLNSYKYVTSPSVKLDPEIQTIDDVKPEVSAIPFSICAKDDLSCIVLGTHSRIPKSNWIHETAITIFTSDYTSNPPNHNLSIEHHFIIGKAKFFQPNSMIAFREWSFLAICWWNGDVSFVNLADQSETLCFHAHSLSATVIFIKEGTLLLTTSADNFIKVWDVDNLLHSAIKDDTKYSRSDKESHDAEPWSVLSDKEQCLDLLPLQKDLVTAGVMNIDGPRFWHLEDGKQNVVTQKIEEIYRASLQENNIDLSAKHHGSLNIYGDTIVYSRSRRRSTCMFAFKNVNNVPSVVGHKLFDDTFASVLSPRLRDSAEEENLYLVREGSLDLCHLEGMKILDSIPIPSIEEEVGNILSNAAKRRLLLFKFAVTLDHKYFIIINPAPVHKAQKYIDLVDLTQKKYLKRVEIAEYFNMLTMFKDGFQTLMKKGDIFSLMSPSRLQQEEQSTAFDYKCIAEGDHSCLSVNKCMGYEMHRNFSVAIWYTEPLRRVCKLKGHLAEVSSCDISRDGAYCVTGSYDQTVRLWYIARSGRLLATFHMYGSVNTVRFSLEDTHVNVINYSAPRHSRASILKIVGKTRKEKTKKLLFPQTNA